jgi:hypothetical protein
MIASRHDDHRLADVRLQPTCPLGINKLKKIIH